MDWRSGRFWLLAALAALVVAGSLALFRSESAADATKALDNTAEHMTGNHAVTVGRELQGQIQGIKSDRAKQFEGLNRR